MAEVIASYQVGTFVVPANGTTGDADQVRGNDNTLRSGLNGHDGDAGVHFQSSTLAARPVAGVAGRKWMSNDDRRIWFDNGSAWLEAAYASTVSPTFTGVVTVPATVQPVGGSATTYDAGAFGSYRFGGGTNIQLDQGGFRTIGPLLLNGTGATGAIQLQTNGSIRWAVQASGHLFAQADGVYDIGAAGANRVRTIYQNGSTVVINAAGAKVLGVPQLGWTTDPTGTLTRTTFDSTTVTLANLAARVAALIVDLRTHGLIAP